MIYKYILYHYLFFISLFLHFFMILYNVYNGVDNMQDHVRLEVSLEIVMAEIAKTMFDLTKNKNNEDIEKRLEMLVALQEKAYKADKESIDMILRGEI